MEQEQIARRIRELGVILESQDNRIRGLEKESKSLVEANAVIANVAAQMNVLAINAAIETSHAGNKNSPKNLKNILPTPPQNKRNMLHSSSCKAETEAQNASRTKKVQQFSQNLLTKKTHPI